MKKFVAVLLTVVLLFSITVPASAFNVDAERESNTFLSKVIHEVRDFIQLIESFIRALFGNKPIKVPAIPPETMTDPDNGSELHLVWNDEFNETSIDSTKWTFRAKMNQGDIRNTKDPRNVTVEDGQLVMRTWKEADGTFTTNTSLTTDGTMSYQYGYIEIYANVPFVEGCWPSFWMQSKDVHRSVPYMTEVDVFEVYDTRNIVAPNIHKWYPNSDHDQAGGRKWGYKFQRSLNLNREYHLYGFGWNANTMYFTVDRKVYYRYDLAMDFGAQNDGMQGFHDPIYVIFNNFIFTENSSWKNPPVNANTKWPITYKVDWIRLYQKSGEGQLFDDTGY